MDIRQPYFSRQGWYPDNEKSCREAVESYLSTFPGQPLGTHAGVVPHAGWIYSGQVAAQTFAALRATDPQVVFLFGGHLHPKDRCVCMPEGGFGTPLGPIAVEEALAQELVSRFECERETAHAPNPDNTIELQLPFISFLWPQAKLVAVQVPPARTAEEIGTWAAQASQEKGLRAVAIGSTDLTHYGLNYGFTPRGAGEAALRWSKEENDRPFLERLIKQDAAGAIGHALANHSACCPGAAVAAASFAKAQGAKNGQLITHTTSHEVEPRGKPSMWVGYAALVY